MASETTDPVPTEGPVSDGPYSWEDGITAEVVSVVASPYENLDEPANDTELRVTIAFSNNGTDVYQFGPDPNGLDSGPSTDLFYGANRYQAQSYYNDQNNLPTQLQPGTAAEWVALFYVPAGETGTLALSVTPDEAHEQWTFAGVEALVS